MEAFGGEQDLGFGLIVATLAPGLCAPMIVAIWG